MKTLGMKATAPMRTNIFIPANIDTVSQVFSKSQEDELVKYIQLSSNMNYGLTYKQIRTLVYVYSSVLPGCKIPDKWKAAKIAGIDWLGGFMKRNKQHISLRKPESTSLARSTGFKKNVSEFFENYTFASQKYKFKPEQIYNLDETGVTTVLKPVKIVSTKGKKQVCQISVERGELTFVGIISAVGSALPPVYVFPRTRNPDEYLIDAPISSLALGNHSGWMTGDLFLRVLEHIKQQTNCSIENKILLLLDNLESHITVKGINYCRNNGIVILSFPPHTSHKLQPLDVGDYGPFKNYCATAFNDWMISNPGKTITIRQIAHLTKIAYQNAFTQNNITTSFQKPGIWPLNRLAFQEEEFLPNFANYEEEHDQQPHQQQTDADSSLFMADNGSSSLTRDPKPEYTRSTPHKDTPKNSSLEGSSTPPPLRNISRISFVNEDLDKNRKDLLSTSAVHKITPETVRPITRPSIKKTNNMKEKKGKSRIFTETLRERRKRIKEERNRKRVLKQVFPEQKEDYIATKKKRKISTSSSDTDESIELASDDMSDDFSDMESANLLTDDDIIQQDDFVLVKFPSKTSIYYYIGRVVEVINLNEFVIKFLRRKTPGFKFYYPLVEDTSTVDRYDLVLKLPQPNSSKTARTSSLLTFNINLSMYNIK